MGPAGMAEAGSDHELGATAGASLGHGWHNSRDCYLGHVFADYSGAPKLLLCTVCDFCHCDTYGGVLLFATQTDGQNLSSYKILSTNPLHVSFSKRFVNLAQ